jgi:hypothetical protein
VDGEMAFEDEVPTVFDLAYGIKPPQIHGGTFVCGEFRPQLSRSVLQPFTDNPRSETFGGILQRAWV